jgi:hypothetical protein
MLEANCPRLLFPLVRGHSGHSRNHDAGRDQRVFTNHDGGTPMASREINLINSAVATVASCREPHRPWWRLDDAREYLPAGRVFVAA